MDAPAVTVCGTRIETVHGTSKVTVHGQGSNGRVAERPFTSWQVCLGIDSDTTGVFIESADGFESLNL
jgi:hypothetical protein